jgi:Domain of unknown function (DUF4266)
MKNNCNLCSLKAVVEHIDERRIWRRGRLLRALVGALAIAVGSGCATLGAKPWEHDLLAEHSMQVDSYPLETTIDDHIYFSKEASSGGRSFAGGGCGCN